MQLQTLEGALDGFRRRMHIALRDRNATVACDSHDGESIHPRGGDSPTLKRVNHSLVDMFWNSYGPVSTFVQLFRALKD